MAVFEEGGGEGEGLEVGFFDGLEGGLLVRFRSCGWRLEVGVFNRGK